MFRISERTVIPTMLSCALLVSYAYFYQAGGWNQNSRAAPTCAGVSTRAGRTHPHVAAATRESASRRRRGGGRRLLHPLQRVVLLLERRVLIWSPARRRSLAVHVPGTRATVDQHRPSNPHRTDRADRLWGR